ncbi:MAG: FtsX-like permease family protein, partial [Candidatus Berkelbacteria bacterium]|nr:FtsX-like permease family protein [Candidatus Berkelbacteria bacterium]
QKGHPIKQLKSKGNCLINYGLATFQRWRKHLNMYFNKTLQSISDQAGKINSITVEADSIDNVASLTSEIKSKLGDIVDVTSQQDSSQSAIKPLENIKTISFYSLIGSLLAGTVIIFLTMVMIVRERRREIGVLKAIGASNIIVVTQFTVESLVLTLLSSVVGIILGLVLSNPVLKVLVNNSSSTSQAGGPAGGGARGMMMQFGMSAQGALRDLHAIVGWEIIIYGLLAAVIIAFLGSAIPSFVIAKVRPAEVLRSE